MGEEVVNSYVENIERFINFINDLATEIYYEQLMCDGKTLFQCGACYEFVKIIKNFFEIDNILIDNDYCHCAIEYNGNYYDSLGIIRDKENFSVATEEDMLYIEERFGVHFIRYKIYETIMNEMSCIENIPYLPSKHYQTKINKKIKK